jgi:hypothetical protein
MAVPSGSDYDLDSGLSGTNFRTELNSIVLALLTMSADTTAPPESNPFMLRADTSTTPDEVLLRNPSDNAWLKLMEVTDSAITLFSDGAQVPALGTAQTFTEAQTVDISGSAGLVSIGSSLSTGVVARIPLFGHNSSAANTTGVNLICRLNTNTAASEDFTFEIEVVRGGSSVTVAALGSTTDFTRSGGGGTVNADTLQQDGTDLDDLLDVNRGRLGVQSNFTGTTKTLAQTDQGDLIPFTGSSACTITVPRLAENTVIFVQNDSNGSADITFESAAPYNDVTFFTTRLTLPGTASEAPMCALIWRNSAGDEVSIIGANT